jgi:hypothetical protein
MPAPRSCVRRVARGPLPAHQPALLPALLVALLVVTTAGTLRAQATPARPVAELLAPDHPQRAEILAVVTALFDGMRTADSARIRTLFVPGAQLITTLVRDGAPTVQRDSLEAFLRSVGTPRGDALDERTRNERVFMDGPLAVVWTEYDLFIGSRFSHCGVDAFQLARVGDRWRIISLADTRRREGCAPTAP